MAKKDTSKAAAFLKSKNISSRVVNPQQFANTSASLRKSFNDTLNLIAFLKMNDSEKGPFPWTEQALHKQS